MPKNRDSYYFMILFCYQDKEVEQGGSAPRILSLDDYFLVEKEVETKDDNGKKVTVKVRFFTSCYEPTIIFISLTVTIGLKIGLKRLNFQLI